MEEVKQHLSTQIAHCERMAAALDLQVVAHQRAVATTRAEAQQERAKAAEFRRLLATYDDVDGLPGTWQQAEPAPVRVDEQDVGGAQEEGLDIATLRDKYSAMTPEQRGKFGSFARFKSVHWMLGEQAKTHEANAASEGVDGRKVTHVDVPDREPCHSCGGEGVRDVAGSLIEKCNTCGGEGVVQEAPSELPAAVWVDDLDMEGGQRGLASDRDITRDRWLLQVDMLTPEQKAKYGVGL